VDESAGAPQTAMQMAADKYRGTSRARPVQQYPQPKKRDEYLHFSVMPCASCHFLIYTVQVWPSPWQPCQCNAAYRDNVQYNAILYKNVHCDTTQLPEQCNN
jgi:hypothetical protein